MISNVMDNMNKVTVTVVIFYKIKVSTFIVEFVCPPGYIYKPYNITVGGIFTYVRARCNCQYGLKPC